MSIRRVITDIPVADVPFVTAMIAADNGTIVEQLSEADGQVTIVAEFPEPVISAATAAAQPHVALQAAAWMRIAQEELARGVVEIPGPASNPRIEAYHGTTSGGTADDSVPWCASFVNFCITNAGGRGTNSKAARSWMTWGKDAAGFSDGCIVVLQRGVAPMGHVGFFVGFDGDRVKLLGGNQGDKVSIASFERSRVLARRVAA
ncbi:MAG TPA: TIGR02594 family protein [Burkholderiaceae bacterium]